MERGNIVECSTHIEGKFSVFQVDHFSPKLRDVSTCVARPFANDGRKRTDISTTRYGDAERKFISVSPEEFCMAYVDWSLRKYDIGSFSCKFIGSFSVYVQGTIERGYLFLKGKKIFFEKFWRGDFDLFGGYGNNILSEVEASSHSVDSYTKKIGFAFSLEKWKEFCTVFRTDEEQSSSKRIKSTDMSHLFLIEFLAKYSYDIETRHSERFIYQEKHELFVFSGFRCVCRLLKFRVFRIFRRIEESRRMYPFERTELREFVFLEEVEIPEIDENFSDDVGSTHEMGAIF